MKTVILGAGRRGRILARHLSLEKRDVIVIDSDPKRASDIQSQVDCIVVVGSGTNVAVLNEAEVSKADFFIAVTDSDEINIVACGLVESIKPEVTTIAAIRNLTYMGKNSTAVPILGINYIVNPEAETADEIKTFINRGIFTDAITFEKSDLVLYNVYISSNSSFANKTVAQCRSSIGPEFVIAAINRDKEGIIPTGDTVIKPTDNLSVVAYESDKEQLFKVLGHKRTKAKKIVIVGGSKIARFLLKSFEPSQLKNIVLIEKETDVCDLFASLFPNLLVLQSDITDETIFESERLDKYDLLISLTDNDELNIITASYAKHIGVESTIALIKTNNNYLNLARHLHIDSILSVSEATVDSLLKFMRGSHVSSLHTLFDGKFEVFEFVISEEMKVVNKTIAQIPLQNRAIIAGVTKSSGKNIIPTGNYQISSGDVLLVCAERKEIPSIQKIFS